MSVLFIGKIIFILYCLIISTCLIYLIFKKDLILTKLKDLDFNVRKIRREYSINISPSMAKIQEKNKRVQLLLQLNPYSPELFIVSTKSVLSSFFSSLNPIQKIIVSFGFFKGLKNLLKKPNL